MAVLPMEIIGTMAWPTWNLALAGWGRTGRGKEDREENRQTHPLQPQNHAILKEKVANALKVSERSMLQ